jgi:hypothetical protein
VRAGGIGCGGAELSPQTGISCGWLLTLLDEAESFFISHIRHRLRILLFLFANSKCTRSQKVATPSTARRRGGSDATRAAARRGRRRRRAAGGGHTTSDQQPVFYGCSGRTLLALSTRPPNCGCRRLLLAMPTARTAAVLAAALATASCVAAASGGPAALAAENAQLRAENAALRQQLLRSLRDAPSHSLPVPPEKQNLRGSRPNIFLLFGDDIVSTTQTVYRTVRREAPS